MNYGKESAAKQAKKLSDSSHKKKKHFGVTLLKFVFIVIVSIILGGTIFAYMFAKDLIADLPDASTIDISPTGYMSTVYDSDGNEIETLAASGANRTYVTLDQIPLDLQHAFVALEDERFYEHNGIDMKSIIRAAYTGVSNGFHFSQGGSTITQQLLKNNYFTTWTSENTFRDKINRKIQEQYLAVEVEKVVSKDTILENYLNSINLGQNTLGVEAASERYFNKSVSELNLSEAACIAAITQNPSRYNPITHPEENVKRRKKALTNMLDQGYITKAEYEEAIDDDVYDRIATVNNDISSASTSYFVDALTDQVVRDLQNKLGYTESEAYSILYSGGLDIYSTQHSDIQSIVEEEINNVDNYSGLEKVSFSYRLTVLKANGDTKNYSETTMLSYYQASNKDYSINFKDEETALEAIEKYKEAIMEEGDTIAEGGETLTFTLQPQAAMTVIDHNTGQVVALVGGRGEKTASKTLNRATGITRQPGSTFKIVAAYAAALDAGGMTLATVENDAPMTYANGTPLSNYDNYYRGWTNLRTAITHSINVVTVRTLTDIGTTLGYQYVNALGITTLIDGDNNQALALGGITNGVTNLELTGAYATIANQGRYNEPIFYTQIVDHQGNVILDNTDNQSTQILKETTSFLLTSAMRDVMTSGTGTPANFSGMAVAGKSGTTTKNRDTVFAGYTPYYTAVIWGGFDDNTPQNYTKYSKTIWRKVMSRIHSGLAYKEFPVPEDGSIVQVAVCSKSGKLPIEGVCDCDPTGSKVYVEYFAEGTEPTEYCDIHYRGTRCNDTGLIANSDCGNTSYGIWILDAADGTEDSFYGIILRGLTDLHCYAHGGAHTGETSYIPTTDYTYVPPLSEDVEIYLE